MKLIKNVPFPLLVPRFRNFFGLGIVEQIFIINMVLLIIHFYSKPVFGIGLDIGRVYTLMAAPLYLFYIAIYKLPELKSLNVILSGLLIFSILLSLILGDRIIFEYAKQQMLIYMFGVLLGAFVYVMAVNRPTLLRGMGYIIGGWLAICLFFAVISAFYYYILDRIPFESTMSEDQLKSARGGRMMLPAVKPPHLSVEMTLLFIWSLFFYISKKRISQLLFSVLTVSICLLTFSRSGFVTLIFTFTTVIFIGSSLRLIRVNLVFISSLIALGLIALIYPFASEFFFYELNISGLERIKRLDIETLQYGRHFDLRLQALEIFANASFLEQLYGIGVGQFRTEGYGPYAFSLYLTALAEQGLFGFTLTIALFSTPVVLSLLRLFNPSTRSIPFLIVFAMSLALALSNLFYELKNAFPIWITLGWTYAMLKSNPSMVLQSFHDLMPQSHFHQRFTKKIRH